MVTESAIDLRREEELDELIAAYLDQLEAGRTPRPEEWLDRHPEFKAELAAFFADRGNLERLTAPLRAITRPLASIDSPGRLGDFQIVRELGRGGMGVVFEAEQISLGRRVALKVLPFAAMLDKQQLARFKNEARAAATLDHPGIVAIFSVGSERGVHYYAMQLVEGQSLAQLIATMRGKSGVGKQASAREVTHFPGTSNEPSTADTQPIAALSTIPAFDSRDYFRSIAQLGVQAAEALDHAHQNGVLHRDVKPANLMVDDAGKLWITDFGLARMEADAGMTMTGDILGTLRYMSPEQALAKRVVVDHRSDIYSLGVTLYELLTLQPAYAGHDRQELLRQIASEDPRPPRQINARIPQDLETIIRKSIEKDPADRYATAQDLRDDLRAFLEHRPVVARPASLAQRARKWSRRHPAVLWSASLVLLATTLVSAISAALIMGAYRREATQRQTAQQHLGLAQEAVDEMLTKVASTWVAESTATSVVQQQFLERALAIYERLAQAPPDGQPRGADAATAYERIADIQRHLGEFAKATASLQTAVGIWQELTAQRGADAVHAEQLVRCYRKLAGALAQQSQPAEALEATELGVQLATRLVDQQAHSSPLQWELARLLYGRADLLLEKGKLAEAAAAADQVDAIASEQLSGPADVPIDNLVLYPQLANLQTTILRRQDCPDEAAEIARPAIASVFRARASYPDFKPLLEVDADLHENLGDLLLAQGDSQPAADQYREALGLRRQRLGGRNPTQQSFALMFDPSRPVSWRQFEPLAIADYCETQLRLAAALPGVDRPYEAECMLGEALLNAQINNDARRDMLQFWVLHANAAAAVGERLAERKSDEGRHYLQLAAALWNEMRAEFPHAEQFHSGAHDDVGDWDWFRTTHPDFASQSGTRESLKLDNTTTQFWNHMLGRAWFQNEAWESAANHFKQSAELRDVGQAYDWLHLAMAYQHLGQPEKAKVEYDRATSQMSHADALRSELELLRRTAERLLANSLTDLK